MAFVDMESVQFYQPPIKAAAAPKERQSTLSTSIPTFVYDGNNHVPLQNENLASEPAKIFDMIGSPLGGFIDPFFPWTLDSKSNVDITDYSNELDDSLADFQEERFTLDGMLAEPTILYDRKVDKHLQSIPEPEQDPGHGVGLVTMEQPQQTQSVAAVNLEPERSSLEIEASSHEGGVKDGRDKDISGSGDNNPLLRTDSKQYTRSAVGEKQSVKRRRKRFRFTSPFSSDEDSNSYVPTHTPKRQKASAGRRSSSPLSACKAVIYEQQSWEGEVVGERDVQQGRGRPRKQYLIQWSRSWIDGNRLNEPHLLQSWKERKRVKDSLY